MNNIYKKKIFYILNIIVKQGTLNFKNPSWKCVQYKKHGTKVVQNLITEARHRICNCGNIHHVATHDN